MEICNKPAGCLHAASLGGDVQAAEDKQIMEKLNVILYPFHLVYFRFVS